MCILYIYKYNIFSLIHLFEGGILEKMTNTEYEMMINLSKNRLENDVVKTNINDGQKTTQHIKCVK